jgi:hypothetical protein
MMIYYVGGTWFFEYEFEIELDLEIEDVEDEA